MVACVRIQCDLKRLFKTTSTTTPPDDLDWSYVKYQMHAMIGESITPTVPLQDVLQFAD